MPLDGWVSEGRQMSRSDFFRGAAAAALSLSLGNSALAVAELKAIATSAAGAHTQSDSDQGLGTPLDPDTLQVIVASTASDAVVNPNPPPNEWDMECMVGGIGTARYGELAGRAEAAASVLPAEGSFLAGGQVTLNLGFTDGAEVVSNTLPPGTPVTLTFRMTLEATAIHFTDPHVAYPDGTGAAARLELEIRDLDNIAQLPGTGALVINSRGMVEPSRTVELQTAIGHDIEILTDLFVSAGADIDFDLLGFSQAEAQVIADQTGEIFHEPSGDVRLVSDSGHDYAAPEPGRGLLLAVGAGFLLLRSRPRAAS
jgi:hypothetical protein